jgi:thioredoxin reductase
MKFHTPSFLLGVGLTAATFAARARLRPVVVEVAALGVHLGRLGRGLVERQRENVEDLWAEVEERVRERAREARRRAPAPEPERRTYVNGNGAART